ncbi:TPA: Rha family transcriptional regulator [Escherichia albertii]|uniref:toxin YdaT family protein n=1 Tax=Escherichia albertii TaxID=208962 RepID=UPI0010F9C06E|nr:toxin YdaT family protein [Escherichia albertii]WDB36139.1 toxin YdaT family protein [Escherichia albertii]HEB1321746.1 Rha family transcriptional regulator [Escherichia albertii]HEB1326520.1 Rha family transcriptional regulator [Escherichia albertii]HEB1340294.1 Rha family transcriptional regulator [Escherichia albertii]HEB1354212.1 Rha family transcriptional regulator [Escherichia albertii]
MKIKHEHIRMAMNAWARPDGEKVPAAEITRAYFELGMTFPELYDDSHPEALARNTQKIFRWVEKDTPDAVKKIQALLPAIEKAMPPPLVAWMRSHSSAYFRELVDTHERLVRDADELVAVVIAGFNQMNRGGPAGNSVVAH